MNDIKIFEKEEFGKIRVVSKNGMTWFFGSDVAKSLGYSNTRDAISKHVDEEDRELSQLSDTQECRDSRHPHLYGTKVTLINESGLYSLILSSKLPKAKEFKRWVTSEVLPSISRTGGYIAVKEGESDMEVMSRAILIAQETLKKRDERIKRLEEENEKVKPLAEYAESVLDSTSSFTTTQIAQMLDVSATTLNKILGKLGVQWKSGKKWILSVDYMGKGYTQQRISKVEDETSGEIRTFQNMVWTEKGRKFIVDELSKTEEFINFINNK